MVLIIQDPKKIKTLKKRVEKQAGADEFKQYKKDLTGKNVALLGGGRSKGKCTSIHIDKCNCDDSEKEGCRFYERMKIDKHLYDKEGIIVKIFEKGLTQFHDILKGEKDWIIKNGAFVAILHDSPGSMKEFSKLLSCRAIKDRIILFVRKKHHPLSSENIGGIVPQDLVEHIFKNRGMVVTLEDDSIKKNCKIIRKSLRCFIEHQNPTILGRLLRFVYCFPKLI